jgi:hypothetical protein
LANCIGISSIPKAGMAAAFGKHFHDKINIPLSVAKLFSRKIPEKKGLKRLF